MQAVASKFFRTILRLSAFGILLLPMYALAQTVTLPLLDNFAPTTKTQIQQQFSLVKKQPRDAQAIGKLGMILHAYEEFAAAAQCYEQAHQFAPQEFRWLYLLGIAAAKNGNIEKAYDALLAASKIDPTYLPAQIKLADALYDRKQIEAAEKIYFAVTQKNPNAIFAWYGLGRTKIAQQDLNTAINCFERTLILAPHFGAAHYALALALRDVGRMGKAKEHLALYQNYRLTRPVTDDIFLNEILALNIGAQELLNKGLAQEAQGDLAGSIASHEQALASNPNLTQAHINLIQLYGRTAQPDKAANHYQAVLVSNPNLADAHYNFGVLLMSQQKIAEAKIAFAKALASNPQYAEADFNLGVLLLQETKIVEAEQHFRAALTNNPNFRAAHFELGRILVHQENFAEAIKHLQQAVATEDQNTPRYVYALAATQIRAGQRAAGLQTLQRAQILATKYEQKELLASIARDLKILEENK